MTEMQVAAESLAMSDRGREALRSMLEWMDQTGVLGLDARGKASCLVLIQAAFTSSPGSARDAMRDALGGE